MNNDTKIDDGGPAYPAPAASKEYYGSATVYMGLTIRDYFAGLAMQALATARNYPTDNRLGDSAYVIADDMLRARRKSPS